MFQLKPILSEIKTLYAQPISSNRFQTYLNKLQGDSKDDLRLPIMGFNPMAKDHILQKIEELERLKAEEIMSQVIQDLNATFKEQKTDTINVVLNLADDLKGAWTNRYSTDFDNTFRINGLVNRNFCTPYFWTNETYDESLIVERTTTAMYRIIYWQQHPNPQTLEAHFQQELFVAQQRPIPNQPIQQNQFEFINTFYQSHKTTDKYDVIFNFFYGDTASKSLGYKQFGIKEITGFDYANYLANQ